MNSFFYRYSFMKSYSYSYAFVGEAPRMRICQFVHETRTKLDQAKIQSFLHTYCISELLLKVCDIPRDYYNASMHEGRKLNQSQQEHTLISFLVRGANTVSSLTPTMIKSRILCSPIVTSRLSSTFNNAETSNPVSSHTYRYSKKVSKS